MRVPTSVPNQQQQRPAAGALVRQEFGSTIQETRSETNVQAAEAEAMVKARCIMARSNPRSLDVVRQKVLADCQRPLFADKAIWSKPVGQEDIEGPSVRFAESLARHMGNLDVNATIAEDTPDRRRIRVSAMDLETNTTSAADVVISKMIERKDAKDREVIGSRLNSYGKTVFIVIATEDELLNKTNSAVSKMRRNKIIELVPADIVEEAMALCNTTLAKADAQDPDAARKKMVDAFLALGISAKDLVAFIGHPLDVLSPAELSSMRRTYNSIKDGETTWAAVVEAKSQNGGQVAKAPPAKPANGKAPAKQEEEDDVDPPHNPRTGEVLEPTAEDAAAAAAREALRKSDEQARAAEAKPQAPATQTVQGQLGIDFGAADATDQVKAKMQAVVDDPAGTVEQLMKVARMAEHCPKERQQELGKFTVQCRTIINGRKKA